jgi:hypothetical protein
VHARTTTTTRSVSSCDWLRAARACDTRESAPDLAARSALSRVARLLPESARRPQPGP